jgi:hypothetical protein
MNRTKKILKGAGKYLVFGLLMGLGGAVLTDVVLLPILRAWGWFTWLGIPKEATQLVLWSAWGYFGVMLAVGVYPMIFKEPPARWMFITDLSLGGFGWMASALAISVGIWVEGIENIEWDEWKDFVHCGSFILTLWYAFRNLTINGAFE